MNSRDSGNISASENYSDEQEKGKGPILEMEECWVV
jgi:hypothetical protein